MRNDLQQRLFSFAVKVFSFLKTLPNTPEYSVVRYQLAKSSTSSGANYEEAQAASSKSDFIYKNEISLREMRESNYWLRLLAATDQSNMLNQDELKYLENESEELKKILGSIVSKSKLNNEH
ncbi:MAG: four helix bundle protein [Prolixibacteraceae bacterium]|nr:four helix bundle protein [Prolixibacteraceae bacterium]